MNCYKCQDQGVILVAVEGWDNPMWENEHVRCGYPSYGNESNYHPLVMNCRCHYNNPIDRDRLVDVVMDWIETYQKF